MRLAAFALGVLGGPLMAQSSFDISFAASVPPSRQISVTVAETIASARPGGYGWVSVDAHNRDLAPHRVDIELQQGYVRDSEFSAVRSLRLESGANSRVFLPLAGLPSNMSVTVTADGNRRESGTHRFDASTPANDGVSALVISADLAHEADWRAALQAAVAGIDLGTTSHWANGHRVTDKIDPLARFVRRAPANLPRSWWMLSGFDLVIVDAGQALDAAVQETVAGYLRAGGSLLVLGAEALDRDSALGSALADWAGPIDVGRFGFGSWAAADAARSRELPRTIADGRVDDTIRTWLGDAVSGVLASHAREWSGPVPIALGANLHIPGLGAVPTGLFFFIVLLFAFFAGPFNYFYWKRQRRLPMLLLTVPAAGAVVTVAMLGFGLLSEGLGVKGAIASVTLLDQRDHVATTWSSRSVYAGLTPGAVVPAAGTYLFSADVALSRSWREPVTHSLDFDLDRRQVAGSLISARTVANLATASVATERERLRFRHRDDGRIEVLQSPGLALASAGGKQIVLRAFDGSWHIGSADGVLSPGHAADVEGLKSGIEDSVWKLAAIDMPVGSYIAHVADDPAVDPLGLEVEWLVRRHVVIGRLAEEDFVRD